MDDIMLLAIGREFARMATSAEQLYHENNALKAKIAELEKTEKPGPKEVKQRV